jgi:hypothetical protein
VRQFLKNLLGNPRTTKTTMRPNRRAARTSLRVEGMEDRTMPSTATLSLGTLYLNLSQDSSVELYELNPTGNRQLALYDMGTPVPTFPIDSIQAVDITLNGQDHVYVNDGDGMPFNSGTTISLHGTGSNNSLTLSGTRTVTGEEKYLSQDGNGNGAILLDNLTFKFDSSVSAVTDLVPINGVYDVETSGHLVGLHSSSSVLFGTSYRTQTFTGLAATGGDTLNFADKPTIRLNENASAAIVDVDAIRTAAGEQFGIFQMWGAYDNMIVALAPPGILTSVVAVNSNQTEDLHDSLGPVLLSGNSTTDVIIGRPAGGGEYSTHSILANVGVSGARSLEIADNANTLFPEIVQVTESSVAGTGLFGSNTARLTYGGVEFLTLMTGQDSAVYNVGVSQAGAEFSTQINIVDFSAVNLKVNVDVADHDHLNLQLYNSNPNRAAELFVYVPSTVNVSGGANGTGDLKVTFPDGSASQIGYQNYEQVEVIG